jgi:hypothetical protein
MLCGCKRNNIEAGAICDGNHVKITDWWNIVYIDVLS